MGFTSLGSWVAAQPRFGYPRQNLTLSSQSKNRAFNKISIKNNSLATFYQAPTTGRVKKPDTVKLIPALLTSEV
jgi:hypothetical protein